MSAVTLIDGAEILPGGLQSVIMPNVFVAAGIQAGDDLDIYHDGKHDKAVVFDVLVTAFDKLGEKELENNVHPDMRSWSNAVEKLKKTQTDFHPYTTVAVISFMVGDLEVEEEMEPEEEDDGA